jgi:hypothetical protein
MHLRRKTRLSVEQLEDRNCPSLTIAFMSGNLTVGGAPTHGDLTVTETAANNFQVKDGTFNYGTYKVTGNITLNLTSHQGHPINIDLGGFSAPNNITINLGLGDNTSNVANGIGVFSSVPGGRINGSLTVQGGSGEETFLPGFKVNGIIPTPLSLAVGADLVFTAKANLAPGNINVMDTGVLFATPPTVTVAGNVRTSAVDGLGLASGTTVGRSVIAFTGGEKALFVELQAKVNQDVTLNYGDSTQGSTVQLDPTAKIGGNLFAGLGNGPNSFSSAPGSVLGNATVLGGAGMGTFTFGGAVNGWLTANLGDGANTLSFQASGSVGGNLTVTNGNSNDSITLDGSVAGNTNVSLGNGDNTVTIGSAPEGTLFWTSGNGNDSVTFGDTTNAPSIWNVQMRFGTGNDTLTLAGKGTVATPNGLTGFIDMGGPPAGNSFDPTGSLVTGTWIIVSPFSLQNV